MGQRKAQVVGATGETPSLLERFDEIRQNEVELCLSPFDNAPWDVNKDFKFVDCFELGVMALIVAPQFLVVYPVLFVLLLPPVACNLMYMTFLVPSMSDTIPRTCWWKLHCAIQAVLCVPAAAVAACRCVKIFVQNLSIGCVILCK